MPTATPTVPDIPTPLASVRMVSLKFKHHRENYTLKNFKLQWIAYHIVTVSLLQFLFLILSVMLDLIRNDMRFAPWNYRY